MFRHIHINATVKHDEPRVQAIRVRRRFVFVAVASLSVLFTGGQQYAADKESPIKIAPSTSLPKGDATAAAKKKTITKNKSVVVAAQPIPDLTGPGAQLKAPLESSIPAAIETTPAQEQLAPVITLGVQPNTKIPAAEAANPHGDNFAPLTPLRTPSDSDVLARRAAALIPEQLAPVVPLMPEQLAPITPLEMHPEKSLPLVRAAKPIPEQLAPITKLTVEPKAIALPDQAVTPAPEELAPIKPSKATSGTNTITRSSPRTEKPRNVAEAFSTRGADFSQQLFDKLPISRSEFSSSSKKQAAPMPAAIAEPADKSNRPEPSTSVSVRTANKAIRTASVPAATKPPVLIPPAPPTTNSRLVGPDINASRARSWNMDVDGSQLLKSVQPIAAVKVSDPNVCDVKRLGPSEVLVTGKSSGIATVRLSFDTGAPPQFHVLHIGQAADGKPVDSTIARLRAAFAKQFPGRDIEIQQNRDSLIVKGTAADRQEAIQMMAFVRDTCLVPVVDQLEITRGNQSGRR